MKRTTPPARKAWLRLDRRSGRDIGGDWFKRALFEAKLSAKAAEWLRAGKLAGDDLDVEWIKGLVVRPNLRQLVMDVLGNRELVDPARIGRGWLLTMTRSPDVTLAGFARRYLLEHFTPDDLGGIDRIWEQLADRKTAEPVREFLATYLSVHHPGHGPTTLEATTLGTEPKLGPDAYPLDRIRPFFDEELALLRTLATNVGRYEVVRWGDRGLLYDLAASRHREPRTLAAEILQQIGKPEADAELVPPIDWLDPIRIFALTEGPARVSREIALNLIVDHYDRLGGPRRLAWLMESPEREVRNFAVRLLWHRHRPRETPPTWSPPKAGPELGASERFESNEALQQFLRAMLFGLPPGRRPRQDAAASFGARAMPASMAKRRLIEVVRDFALEDVAFARIAVPVLTEFARSVGKGEWQACVTALVQLRRAHPDLGIDIGTPVPSPAAAGAKEVAS